MGTRVLPVLQALNCNSGVATAASDVADQLLVGRSLTNTKSGFPAVVYNQYSFDSSAAEWVAIWSSCLLVIPLSSDVTAAHGSNYGMTMTGADARCGIGWISFETELQLLQQE